MFGFPHFRTAVPLLLIAALAMQPVAALGVGTACPASGDCHPSDAASCCSGESSTARGPEQGCCCGHAAEPSDSPGQMQRECTCGHFSQPLNDTGSRPTPDSQRTSAEVAFAASMITHDVLTGGEARRVGVAQPGSPPRFSQRRLCIWRL